MMCQSCIYSSPTQPCSIHHAPIAYGQATPSYALVSQSHHVVNQQHQTQQQSNGNTQSSQQQQHSGQQQIINEPPSQVGSVEVDGLQNLLLHTRESPPIPSVLSDVAVTNAALQQHGVTATATTTEGTRGEWIVKASCEGPRVGAFSAIRAQRQRLIATVPRPIGFCCDGVMASRRPRTSQRRRCRRVSSSSLLYVIVPPSRSSLHIERDDECLA